MKRFALTLTVSALMALTGATGAEPDKEKQPLHLELELVDGSRLIGTPSLATVPMQTSYAKMDVPLTQIKAMKIGDDHETVTRNLRNGDKLTGVVSLAPIELKTVFKTVSIGGYARFRLNGGIVDGQGQVSTSESMERYMGKWTHLVGTYADGEQKIYVNGRLSGTQTYQQSIQNDASPLVVGGYYSAGHLYQGDLDALMIFNRALSGAEIEQLYKLR